MKKSYFLISVIGLTTIFGCSIVDKKAQNKEWFNAENEYLKNAAELTSEYITETSPNRLNKKELSDHFHVMCGALDSYQTCIGELKVKSEECHRTLLDAMGPHQTSIETMIRVIPKPQTLQSKEDLIIYSGPLMMNLILSKYFKLMEDIHRKAGVSFVTRPYVPEPWTAIARSSSELMEEDPLPQYSRAHSDLEKNMVLRLEALELKAQTQDDQLNLSKLKNILALLNPEPHHRELGTIQALENSKKEIWLSEDLWKDDLKYASVRFATEQWKNALTREVFDIQGKYAPLKETLAFSFNYPKQGNVLFLRDSIIARDLFIHKEITQEPKSLITKERDVVDATVFVEKRHGLGMTVHHLDYGETHIGLMNDKFLNDGNSGYCYEETIFPYLPVLSSYISDPKKWEAVLCKENDSRYNFVAVVTHALGHYLGLLDTDTDAESVMFHHLNPGLSPYHFDGLKEQYGILNAE